MCSIPCCRLYRSDCNGESASCKRRIYNNSCGEGLLHLHFILACEADRTGYKRDARAGERSSEVVDIGGRGDGWRRRRFEVRRRFVPLLHRRRRRLYRLLRASPSAFLPVSRLPLTPDHPSTLLQHVFDAPDRDGEVVLRGVAVLGDEVKSAVLRGREELGAGREEAGELARQQVSLSRQERKATGRTIFSPRSCLSCASSS